MRCTICKAEVEEDGSNTNYCQECRGITPKKLGEKYSERMEKEGAREVSSNDFFPRRIYVRTFKTEEGEFELLYSAKPFKYTPGEVFFQHGEFWLHEISVIGSGFKIKFSDSEKEEPGRYSGVSDRRKKLNR